MPDSSYPERTVDPDLHEGHTWRPTPLCVWEKLSGNFGVMVLKSIILKIINKCSMTNGPTGMEPQKAGVFICFVHGCGFNSQNRTQQALNKEAKVKWDWKIRD